MCSVHCGRGSTTAHINQYDGPNKISYTSFVNNRASISYNNKQLRFWSPLQHFHLYLSRIMSILDFLPQILLNLSSRGCKRRMSDRAFRAQREDSIRRTVYVYDNNQNVTKECLVALFSSYGQVSLKSRSLF